MLIWMANITVENLSIHILQPTRIRNTQYANYNPQPDPYVESVVRSLPYPRIEAKITIWLTLSLQVTAICARENNVLLLFV